MYCIKVCASISEPKDCLESLGRLCGVVVRIYTRSQVKGVAMRSFPEEVAAKLRSECFNWTWAWGGSGKYHGGS